MIGFVIAAASGALGVAGGRVGGCFGDHLGPLDIA